MLTRGLTEVKARLDAGRSREISQVRPSDDDHERGGCATAGNQGIRMPLEAIVSPSALVRGTRPVARSGAVATALTLSKARITGLIVLTGVVAAFMAPRGAADPAAVAWFILAASLGSAGAAMLNHYLDRDLDACMERTRSRPLPAGAVSPRLVLGLGLGSLGTSLALAPLAHPRLPLWIGLGAVTYVVVYTWWLKRRTPLSVVIGGCTGSCC